MGELVNLCENNIAIKDVEADMLTFDQAYCPVFHHFGPGIYIREVHLSAGVFAIGHEQKFEHLNIMVKGKVAILKDGEIQVLQAPMIFRGKAGRKVGLIIEDCVWQNVYATEETDIQKLEEKFLDKSVDFEQFEQKKEEFERILRKDDVEDYFKVLEEFGFTDEVARQQSEDESDQIELPEEWSHMVTKRRSNIEGFGMFSNVNVAEDKIIAPAKLSGKRTTVGRYLNHSKNPNCKFVCLDERNIFLKSLRPIMGCRGGDHGEELTVDYRQSLRLLGLKSCQE